MKGLCHRETTERGRSQPKAPFFYGLFPDWGSGSRRGRDFGVSTTHSVLTCEDLKEQSLSLEA